MLPDDQYSIDFAEIDTHQTVSSETVIKAMSTLGITDYQLLVDFLEPKTEDEKRIIRDTIRDYSLPDYC
jgi:hypothetical protein